MRILVTGGTGLVGRHLLPRLVEAGHTALVLSRQANPPLPAGCTALSGDPTQDGPWLDQIGDCDAVINLAGENLLGRRWRRSFKQRLISSRIESTRRVAEALARNPHRTGGAPKILVSASAIGYYGPTDREELDEESSAGNDFLATLCVDWEKAAQPARDAGVRVVHPRIGMVCDRKEGALPKLARPFRWFVGGPVGDGKQWISWIHIEDLVGLIMFALERPEVSGPINATAPEPLTNWGISALLAHILHRPNWMRVPKFMLRILLGEAATVVVNGQRVIPRQALKLGYVFRYAEPEPALRDLLNRPKPADPAAG